MDSAATPSPCPSVSVVVPTYREAQNIPSLIERIDRVRREHDLDLELLIMDDDSRDGTAETVQSLGRPWVRLVTRIQNRGLSPAVLDGFALARHDLLLVMDADLSHPPEKIPEMLDALTAGHDFVVGSRYVPGGSTDHDWGPFRWINSRAATLLARPLTSIKDPMSGFFALRRETYQKAATLNPVGYKIALELLVKADCRRVCEIPIHFGQRRLGDSKLSLREQLSYIRHLRRLFIHKYGHWARGAILGASATALSLAALSLLYAAGISLERAAAAAILVAITGILAPLLVDYVLRKQKPTNPEP